MEAFLATWSYLGIFLGIVATGLGFPMPEELPVVVGGALVRWNKANFLMLPVCIAGVIVGDTFLYAIGRFWGAWLVERSFVKKRLITPQRLESIRDNFHQYGIKILLFARLTPGIRAPIFLTAGITRLPFVQFLFADGIYAIPGVSLLFILGFYFTDGMISLIEQAEIVKTIFVLVVVGGVAGYFSYRFLRRPMVTGDPTEVPTIVNPMQQTLQQMTEKIMHPSEKSNPPGADPASDEPEA